MLQSPLRHIDSQAWECITQYLSVKHACKLFATGSRFTRSCLAFVRRATITKDSAISNFVILVRLLRLNLTQLHASNNRLLKGLLVSVATSKLATLSFSEVSSKRALYAPPTLTSLYLGFVTVSCSTDYLHLGDAQLVHFGFDDMDVSQGQDKKSALDYLIGKAVLPFTNSIESLHLGCKYTDTVTQKFLPFIGLASLSVHPTWIKKASFPSTLTRLKYCNTMRVTNVPNMDAFGNHLVWLDLNHCGSLPSLNLRALKNLQHLKLYSCKLLECEPTQMLHIVATSLEDVQSSKLNHVKLSQKEMRLESGILHCTRILQILDWKSVQKICFLYDARQPNQKHNVDYGCIKMATNLTAMRIQCDVLATFEARGGLDFFRNVVDLKDLSWSMSSLVAQSISASRDRLSITVEDLILIRTNREPIDESSEKCLCIGFDWLLRTPAHIKLQGFAVGGELSRLCSLLTSPILVDYDDAFVCEHCQFLNFEPSPHLKSRCIYFYNDCMPKMQQLPPSLAQHVLLSASSIIYSNT